MKNTYIGLITMALLISASAITVNATTNHNYDVNGDNSINVVDVLDVKKAVLNGETVDTTITTTAGSTTTYPVYTTAIHDTYTTKAITTTKAIATTKAWTTVLDEDVKSNMAEKYKTLALDYISENAPDMYDSITDISVELFRYDGLYVVTTTEAPAVTTAPVTQTDIYGNVKNTTVTATTVAGFGNDACVRISFSKNINPENRQAFPKAYLYDKCNDYVEIYFKDGFVSRID